MELPIVDVLVSTVIVHCASVWMVYPPKRGFARELPRDRGYFFFLGEIHHTSRTRPFLYRRLQFIKHLPFDVGFRWRIVLSIIVLPFAVPIAVPHNCLW